VTNVNTAACESLPSALENFILHFYGSVIKTEVNNVVTWSLPCDLSVGLENNPRSADEGLACYFLRLFEEGITGATGPTGPAGANGADGRHAFTVTLENFTHPAVGGSITVKAYATPVIAVGQTVFVTSSGWYDVAGVSGDGTLVLTLLQAVSGATGNIAAGRVITITGPRGITGSGGATGAQGIQGIQGPAGDEYTPTNGFVVGAGANHSITLASTVVQFGGTEPEITLPAIGKYAVDIIVGVTMDAGAAASPGEQIICKLWNATAAAFVSGFDSTVQCFDPDQEGQIHMIGTVTTTVPNETLQLYAQVSVDGNASVVPAETKLRYIRLS
jgi:hypothetical protein